MTEERPSTISPQPPHKKIKVTKKKLKKEVKKLRLENESLRESCEKTAKDKKII
jgi:hypothetical protein